jgi:hypothetical protein
MENKLEFRYLPCDNSAPRAPCTDKIPAWPLLLKLEHRLNRDTYIVEMHLVLSMSMGLDYAHVFLTPR